MKKTLIAIGEALIDFIPQQTGCDFADVSGFSPKCGGAPANVCGAYSVLGGKSKMITQLGNDPFGHKIVRELESYGIDTSCIKFTDAANTALAFVSLSADKNRTFSFYRKPSADMLMSASDISFEWFNDAYALHFCSVSLGNFPMKSAHIKAIEYARASGAIISFDPNLRFQLWNNKNELIQTVREFIPRSDILKISDEELEFITGTNDIKLALPMLLTGNVKMVIYTCGKNGAYAFTGTQEVYSSGFEVDVADTTGAGDGFIGAFIYALNYLGVGLDNLRNTDENTLKKCLDFSNRFCGESVRHEGAISSYRALEI